jgi:hypothetical protein
MALQSRFTVFGPHIDLAEKLPSSRLFESWNLLHILTIDLIQQE